MAIGAITTSSTMTFLSPSAPLMKISFWFSEGIINLFPKISSLRRRVMEDMDLTRQERH